MDQLHEELKQPILENDEKEEESAIPDVPKSPGIGRVSSDRQMSLDALSSSSQSDGDYETCDSALGSERGSAEQNCSSDENSDFNEFSRLSLSSYKETKTPVRRFRNSLGRTEDTVDDTSNTRQYSVKEHKDNVNLCKKAVDNVSLCSDDQRSDSGEFIDAESEPLRHTHSSSKRSCKMTDKEMGKRPVKQKPQNYLTCSGE